MNHIIIASFVVMVLLIIGCPMPVEAQEDEKVTVQMFTVKCLTPDTTMPKAHRVVCNYLRSITEDQEVHPTSWPHRALRKGEVIL